MKTLKRKKTSRNPESIITKSGDDGTSNKSDSVDSDNYESDGSQKSTRSKKHKGHGHHYRHGAGSKKNKTVNLKKKV